MPNLRDWCTNRIHCVRIALAVIAILCPGPRAQAQLKAAQWRSDEGGNDHWYALIERPYPSGGVCGAWHCHVGNCAALGGYLATATSTQELQFIAAVARGNYSAIGGTIDVTVHPDDSCSADVPRWLTGEPWPSEFGSGSYQCPFSMYGYIQGPSIVWAPAPSASSNNAIAEMSADCNGDGIIDFGQCVGGTLADLDRDYVPDCCSNATPCDSATHPVQWTTASGGNGHWYQIVTSSALVSWESARAIARARGGDLAKADSNLCLEFLFRLSALTPGAWRSYESSWIGPWLGASRAITPTSPNGTWQWTDGSPVNLDTARAILGAAGFCEAASDQLCFWKPGPSAVRYETETYRTTNFPGSGICVQQTPVMTAFIIEWSNDCTDDDIVDIGQILTGTLADWNQNGLPDICDGSAARQWRTEDGGNGHWYMAVPLGLKHLDWANPFSQVIATTISLADGGHLATATTAPELEFIRFQVPRDPGSYWLGGRSGWGDTPASPFAHWLTGEPWLATIQPYTDPCCCCIGMGLGVTGPEISWIGEEFSGTARGFISEWSADCNADGIVDFAQCVNRTLRDDDRNFVPDCCETGAQCTATPACPGDVVPNGAVDGEDLGELLARWGISNPVSPADLNADGVVDGADLGRLLYAWGACP